jgi:hypothetical protein
LRATREGAGDRTEAIEVEERAGSGVFDLGGTGEVGLLSPGLTATPTAGPLGVEESAVASTGGESIAVEFSDAV